MPVKVPRECIVSVVSVILRVPALFIAEAWYRTDPNAVQLPNIPTMAKIQYQGRQFAIERTHHIVVQTVYYSAIILAVVLMFLPLKKLVNLYMYIVTLALLTLAHYLSYLFVEAEKAASHRNQSVFEDAQCIQHIGFHLAAQGIISAVIAYLINLKQWTKLTLLIYTLPMFSRMVSYPVEDLHRVHNFATVFAVLVIVFYIFNQLPVVMDFLKAGAHKTYLTLQMYGWIPVIIAMWFKIFLPVQFLVFWLVLFMMQLYKYLSVANHPIFQEGWIVVLLASIAECCVTPISLMGLCVTVSYVSWLVLTLTRVFLKGRQGLGPDNVMHRGWTEGFTMFLLAVQTGIIELKPPQRAFLMSIVLFIVVSSLIQSMYELTDPVLLALSASQNKKVWKHVRAILLCTFLWMFPLIMTHSICQFFDLDFWLLVIISSCVLTSVQVLGSLVVYSLFMYDAIREEPWEHLDDVVYYAKATTRVLEFIVAVFVVCYGVKESLIGEWSWINSSILIIHCYFNVWQRLQSGWKTYLLRREAVKKIASLPTATDQQLKELNDVCAICFQELHSACITPCSHFFHCLCLRKWLYVQDNCPLCHKKIQLHSTEDTAVPPTADDQNEEENGENQEFHDAQQQID